MKLCLFTKLFFVIFFFLTWNTRAFALAGFAESDSTLHYNNFANISWMHPGDGCRGYSPYGQYCFYLLENNSLANQFNKALQKISIPENSNNPFILMEDTEGQWIVYDLKSKGNIFESNDFESALKRWKDFGFLAVNFANATNLSDFFGETEESKQKNTTSWSEFPLLLIVIIYYIFLDFWPGITFGILFILGVYIYERYYSSFYLIQKKMQ